MEGAKLGDTVGKEVLGCGVMDGLDVGCTCAVGETVDG